MDGYRYIEDGDLKFEIPHTIDGRINMHDFMLLRVRSARQDITKDRVSLLQRIGQKSALGFDTGADQKILQNLRRQELCLVDQESLRCLICFLETFNST